MLLSKLLAGHARLREIASAIEAILAGPPPSSQITLSRLRWDLTREVLQHHSLEDHLTGTALKDRKNDEGVIGEFRRDLQPLNADYQHHMVRWQGVIGSGDWNEYCRSALILLARLRARMLDEEERLYPLIADGGPSSVAEAG